MSTTPCKRTIGSIGVIALTLLAVLSAPFMTGVSNAAGRSGSARSIAAPIVLSSGSDSAVLAGAVPHFVWPKTGQAAVAVRGIGLVGNSPNEQPVPIASLTKMMTALVILHDHPLASGESGPVLSITAADVATYEADVAAGDSTLRVVAGEQLSEYQLLEGLLIPSGDNIATLLAAWDAGTTTAFVEKMNATASSLGLAETHYGDPAGLSPASRSTAADQAKVAAQLMSSAVIRSIVAHPTLTFPFIGTVSNYNPALGIDGIIGVKSGWTTKAQSCLVTAAYRSVDEQRNVLVISVALGQPGSLVDPAHLDERLLNTIAKGLELYRVIAPSTLPLPGITSTIRLLAPTTTKPLTLWHGLHLTEQVVEQGDLSTASLASASANTVVATLEVRAPWGIIERIPLQVSGASIVPDPNGTTTTSPPPAN